MLWPYSTTTRNACVVRGWETTPVSKNKIARYVILQLATPTYKARKERGEQKKSKASSDATPTLVDPSDVTPLGRVSTDKLSSVECTPKQKKCSDGSPSSSKCKHSSKPTSDDLKSLDDKWSERFSRLEAMLLNQFYAVPVRPVCTASVVTREHPLIRVLLLVLCLLRVLVPVLLRLPVNLHS